MCLLLGWSSSVKLVYVVVGFTNSIFRGAFDRLCRRRRPSGEKGTWEGVYKMLK